MISKQAVSLTMFSHRS